jgi:uncharacterized protein
MLDQRAVDQWLQLFLERLRESFDGRLRFVGHHGSWARGESRPESDIDAIVILDTVDDATLRTYGQLIHDLSEVQPRISTFLGSIGELKAWPPHDRYQLWYGCKILHGSLDNLIDRPTKADFLEDIRLKASAQLHLSRHYLLHPHDLTVVIHKLYYPFKECVYALQSWMLLVTGTYYPRKADLSEVLTAADDREVLRVARDWHQLAPERTERPKYFIELLERWSRTMLERIANVRMEAQDNPRPS